MATRLPTVDGKGEAATPAKRADVSGGQECGVEDVQRVETPAAEITIDTEIVKNKDQERGGSEREEERPSPWPARGAGRKHCWFSSIQLAWQQGTLLTGGTTGALALTSGRGGSGRQATPPVAGLRRRMESRRR
uniref:Uncharacterized protein n=1 Tax=Oryza nivara TaxID=4536 RepID=A0A679BB56_ORYNI|nr:hypothetical protein [Oryza sativa f. spontanea]